MMRNKSGRLTFNKPRLTDLCSTRLPAIPYLFQYAPSIPTSRDNTPPPSSRSRPLTCGELGGVGGAEGLQLGLQQHQLAGAAVLGQQLERLPAHAPVAGLVGQRDRLGEVDVQVQRGCGQRR